MAIKHVKKEKVFQWFGRILASLVTLLIGWGLIVGFLLGGYRWPEDFSVIHTAMIVVLLLGLAGIILSWKRPAVSGPLLITNSMVIGVAICTLWTDPWYISLYNWFMCGLPYLVAGIMLIVSWFLSSENRLHSIHSKE
jgi:hypothetical protein